MRIRHTILASLLAGGLLAGCADLDLTNPNEQNAETYWRTAADANRGLTSAYNALLFLGTYSRWHIFANDIRSDIGTARTSPWGDLANFNAFQLNNYDFEVNRELWIHNYELVGRANQVIANVPRIEMNATERDRIVGEAKFLRALGYFNLVTLFENVPMPLEPQTASSRPASSPPAATWAQIEQDLVDAAAVLPETYDTDRARATKGAALAMLGKARLQMAGVLDLTAKWGEAATTLNQVVALNRYQLLSSYAANFVEASDFNNTESLFEVSTEDQFPVGVTGISFPKMIGPCYRPGGGAQEFNPTFCDGRPTRWYFEQFQQSRTATGGIDPRMDVTLLYDRPAADAELVFGRTRASFFENVTGSPIRADTMLFFRKYAEWQTRTDQRWDNPINYKVIRYADVLLMLAEALNESGGANPVGPLNQVRERVGKAPVLATLTRAQLRDTILYERMFELGLEASRFNDLRRHDLLSPALAARDPDFATFVVGKSERLPIPTTERNLNPNVPQNPQW